MNENLDQEATNKFIEIDNSLIIKISSIPYRDYIIHITTFLISPKKYNIDYINIFIIANFYI